MINMYFNIKMVGYLKQFTLILDLIIHEKRWLIINSDDTFAIKVADGHQLEEGRLGKIESVL